MSPKNSKKTVKKKKKPEKVVKQPLKGKKKLMREALWKSMGVVTAACKKVGIDRTTHYLWLREDPNYKIWVEELPDRALDFAESALFGQIDDGDTKAIIFYLKTKGKSRGFIEKQEVEIAGSIALLTKAEREAEIRRLLKK